MSRMLESSPTQKTIRGQVSVQVDPESAAELEALCPPLEEFCCSCEDFLRQVLQEFPIELARLEKQDWVSKIGQEFFQEDFWQAWQLGLVLCNDSRMSVWNQQFRNIDGPTDILSFPSQGFLKETDELAEKILGESERGGDLLLSLPSWLSNCREFACEPETELQRLLIHGVLHLAGLDHDEAKGILDEKLGTMLQLQEYLLTYSLQRRSILK